MKHGFEKYMIEQYMKLNPGVLDDDLWDDAMDWLYDLPTETLITYADAYGRYCAEQGKEVHENA